MQALRFSTRVELMMENNDKQNAYEGSYTDAGFWEKSKGFAKTAGKTVLEPALKMYHAANDPDTPIWARSTAYGGLGYFILPLDVIPDLAPAIGYTDDASVLAAALAAIAAHVKQAHVDKARETLRLWFD